MCAVLCPFALYAIVHLQRNIQKNTHILSNFGTVITDVVICKFFGWSLYRNGEKIGGQIEQMKGCGTLPR